MKETPLKMTLLFDFYGEILTEKQRDFFDLYHNNDLSLSEIAENAGITRQGVRDVIFRSEQVLANMESKLGLVARHYKVKTALEDIVNTANQLEMVNNRLTGHIEITSRAKRIVKLATELLD